MEVQTEALSRLAHKPITNITTKMYSIHDTSDRDIQSTRIVEVVRTSGSVADTTGSEIEMKGIVEGGGTEGAEGAKDTGRTGGEGVVETTGGGVEADEDVGEVNRRE